jgi:ectoine hydroxylase
MGQSMKSDIKIHSQTIQRSDGEGKLYDKSVRNTPGINVIGALARSARIVQTLETLFNDEVYYNYSKINSKKPKIGGSWEWHQDYAYWY